MNYLYFKMNVPISDLKFVNCGASSCFLRKQRPRLPGVKTGIFCSQHSLRDFSSFFFII